MKGSKILLIILGFLIIGCSPKYYKTKREKVDRREVRKTENRRKQPSESNNRKKNRTERNPELLVATSVVAVTPELIAQYIDTYKDVAIVEMQRYKVPASITLAQAILESGSGQGRLARYAHNHFGIKCHSTWQGASVYHDDDEKDECFRKYEDPIQSFEDHSLFLANRSRYAFLFELDPVDYKSWAYGLKKAGYATDSKYPNKLISLIQRYHLHQYDLMALGMEVKANPDKVGNNIYLVETGDTLYSISRKFGLTVDELMKLNQLSDTNIKVGQALRLR